MDPTTEKLKALYLQHLALRNCSALTIRQNELGIRLFCGYLESERIPGPRAVERRHVEAYKVYLCGYKTRAGTPLKVNTVRERVFVIQRWFAYLKKRNLLLADPARDVQAPRRARLLPRGVLRPDEIRRIMEQPNVESELGYRDRTIMEVLYATGARASELSEMRVPDVDLDKKLIRIRCGKGGKDRFVPLTTPSCRFIERYLKEIRPQLAECMRPAGNKWKEHAETGGDRLFLSIYGGPLKGAWLGCMMKRYLFLAGIRRPVSPVHGFRHSVATHLIASGMDVRYVQVFLGHSDINSTQIYTHVERDTLGRLLAKYHPRELAGERAEIFKEVPQNGDRR